MSSTPTRCRRETDEATSVRGPPHKHALEVSLLRFMNPEMNLGKRAGEDERHTRRQTNDRQLQRRD